MRMAHPQILWLLWVIPLLAVVLAVARSRAHRGLVRFAQAERLSELAGPIPHGRRIMRAGLRLFALAFLVVAAARPQWGASEVEVEQEGIDLVVALDISRSMRAEDLVPSRLGRAKVEIGELIESLDGDRIGLVFFAGAAFPQCPLTVDYAAARLFLDQADPDMISAQGTDIGAALQTALELFGEEGGRTRVVLLVTDGEDFAGQTDAVLRRLRESAVVLYAIGLGTAEGAPIPEVDAHGARTGFVRDGQGRVVLSRLEEGALLELVRAGGGVYARAGSAGLDLSRLRDEIRSLEGEAYRSQRVVRYRERYAWPLAIALSLLLFEAWILDPRRRPW